MTLKKYSIYVIKDGISGVQVEEEGDQWEKMRKKFFLLKKKWKKNFSMLRIQIEKLQYWNSEKI